MASMAALSLMWIPTSAKAGYVINLKNGELPKDIAVVNANGLKPVLNCYKAGYTTDGWTVDRVGLKGYCLLSPTHTQSGTSCENILSLPELKIEADMWLRWEAISLSPDMPESYKVIATPAGGESVTLLEVDGEKSEWTSRLIPLEQFAGCKTRIQFVCNSVNRYMLAISGLSVDVPAGIGFITTDETPRFGGILEQKLPKVRVAVTNVNGDANVDRVECIDKMLGIPFGSESVGGTWSTSETRTFEFPVGEQSTEYSVEAVMADGERVKLADGFVAISNFTRNLLVDKGTGTWCVNCPQGMLELEELERMFGSNLIAVETHTNLQMDPLTNDAYWSGLGFYAAPWFMLNRIKGSSGSDVGKFGSFYFLSTDFQVTLSDVKLNGNESAEVTATVTTASDIDNSGDRYRIGYVLTADFHETDNFRLMQRNISNSPSYGRFYFMPSLIPSELMTYHDVSLTSDNAFSGIADSLPLSMNKGDGYTCRLRVDRPELLDDIKNGRLVAYVIDTTTGELENAARISLSDNGSSGTDTFVAENGTLRISSVSDGLLQLHLPETGDYRLEAFDLSGIRRFSTSGTAVTTAAVVETGLGPGIYLVRVSTPDDTAVARILVR